MTKPIAIKALPPLPTLGEENGAAVFEALTVLHLESPLHFDRVFSDRKGAAATPWKASEAHLTVLQTAGILSQAGGKFVPSFLVTPWSGAFYLTDFPDTGFRDEVFSPHPEQVLLTQLLQTRSDDYVLDLCTGSGILLLEAARRGASGLGIDISARATGMARINAHLNTSLLQGQVEFKEGDVTRSDGYAAWGRPTVIISNPPFEPIPDELNVTRPLHSSAGPLGTDVFVKLLDALARWKHTPKLFQFVLFSLGKTKTNDPRDLLMGRLLQDWSSKHEASVDLQELLAPLSIRDYLAVHLGAGPRDVPAWQRSVDAEGFDAIHLLFGVMRPAGLKKRPEVTLSRHDEIALDDACFAWPLCSEKRRGLEGTFRDGSMAARAFASALMDVREKHMEAVRVGFSLMGQSARQLLKPMLQQPMLFGPDSPLVVLDLHSDDTAHGLGDWTDHGALTIRGEDVKYDIVPSQAELRTAVQQVFRGRAAALVLTAWKGNEGQESKQAERGSQTEILGWKVDVGDTDAMLDTYLRKEPEMLQRFVIFSPPATALAPHQQRNCVALLSELVYSHFLGDQRIENAYNSVGHYLKNNLDILMRLLDERRNIRPELKSLYQFAGMFELIGKLGRQPFPMIYLDPQYRHEWPAVAKREDVLSEIAKVLVNRTIYYLQREDYEGDLVIRQVSDGGIAEIGGAVAGREDERIPPFAAGKACRHADLFLLAGLSEICRNAVLATSDNNKNAIRNQYEGGYRHIDFKVSIDGAQGAVAVTIWNPFAGVNVTRSTAVERLSRVYSLLERAVELTPAAKRVYAHGRVKKGVDRTALYAESQFRFFPMRLHFQGARASSEPTKPEVLI